MQGHASYDPDKLIPSSERDGWMLGYIGIPWPGPWPKKNGDLFVVDSEGWQAGLAWESTGPELEVIAGPSSGRWGVFQIRFSLTVMCEQDLVRNFHLVLPLLQQQRSTMGARPLS
jgi:hypothetical protein